ncbi:uncharacterized protein SAPINGB_P001501 [Magnusiomyces paraingens]|uniref:Ribosomal protein L1 n=1 Tax=Magnusiomyces paraingens TaxID=2606893 RepID=A0A5E8B6A1_9ASCO|nr:uncharacterized protein SAPINGB_P001501 [Saprochaete ingens]VVT47015.1 unnamed protein product [Saprochaete ingens]
MAAPALDHLSKRRRKLEQLHRKTLAFSGNLPPVDLIDVQNGSSASSSRNNIGNSISSISSSSSSSNGSSNNNSNNNSDTSSTSSIGSTGSLSNGHARSKHETAFSLATPSSLASYISIPSSTQTKSLSHLASSSHTSQDAKRNNHHRSRLPKDFDKVQVRRSCTALLKFAHAKYTALNSHKPHFQQHTSIEDSLSADALPAAPFPYGEPIYLTIQTFSEIASLRSIVPFLIPLPNRIRPKLADLSICLITRDPRAPIVAVLEADKNSPTHGVFTEIVSAGKLRSKLISFSDAKKKQHRRKHLDQDEPPSKKTKHAVDNPHKAAPGYVKSFDIIVNDSEITSEKLTKIFGPGVYLKAPGLKITIPVPISLQPPVSEDATPAQAQKIKDTIADPLVIKNQLKYIARSSAVIKAPGKNLSILVGLSSFTPEQLMENIAATISTVLQKQGGLIQGSWENVKAITIKTAKSASMPIYQNTAALELHQPSIADLKNGSAVAKAASNNNDNDDDDNNDDE